MNQLLTNVSRGVVALLLVTGCGQSTQDARPPASGSVPVAAATAPTEALAAAEDAVPENPLKEAYFGETHVHTSYSLDRRCAHHAG